MSPRALRVAEKVRVPATVRAPTVPLSAGSPRIEEGSGWCPDVNAEVRGEAGFAPPESPSRARRRTDTSVGARDRQAARAARYRNVLLHFFPKPAPASRIRVQPSSGRPIETSFARDRRGVVTVRPADREDVETVRRNSGGPTDRVF